MMKKRKFLPYFLIICLILSNIVNYTSLTTSAEESTAEVATLEDVIAGMADPSQLSGASTRATTANVVLDDGTYYINGKYSGDYLRNNSSSPIATSGTFSSLGSSIKWKITNVNGSFTIQPFNDTTKYLAVPTLSTALSAIQLVTISGTTIPTECLWNITYADGGGCLIQNVFNSRYLFTISLASLDVKYDHLD